MIQLNLLPDVKLAYVKAKRLQRTVIAISVIISAVSLALLILFVVVTSVVQKNHMANLNEDIESSKQQLESITDLSKILTVQNQLNKLPELHGQKPAASRLFGFMQQVTPNEVSISSLSFKTEDQTITITGSASSLTAVNTYVDTLKFTNAKIAPDNDQQAAEETNLAFKDVVLTSFALSASADRNKAATYSIQLKYNPVLFDNSSTATLVIPKQITTRSETEKPAAIFQTQPSSQEGQR